MRHEKHILGPGVVVASTVLSVGAQAQVLTYLTTLAPQSGSMGVTSVAVFGDTVAQATLGTSTYGICYSSDQWGAWVFAREGSTWSEQMAFQGDPEGCDWFGFSSALTGGMLAVSNPYADHRGLVYLYQRCGADWTPHLTLEGPTQRFGWALGASRNRIVVTSGCDGMANIFAYQSGTWALEASITSATACFGVAAGIDGDIAAFGAPDAPTKVHVYERAGTTWEQTAELTPAAGEPQDGFGTMIEVSGTTIAATHHSLGTSSTGPVYVFEKVAGQWVEQARLQPPSPRIALFGRVLLIGSGDGLLAYVRYGSSWVLQQVLQDVPEAYVNLDMNGSIAAVAGPGGGISVYRVTTPPLCDSAAQCASGYCVDGVCCNSPCTGACVACSAVRKGWGVDGACGPIMAGTDPEDECAAGSGWPGSCAGDGKCDGEGACRSHAVDGTSCGTNKHCIAGACVSGTFNCPLELPVIPDAGADDAAEQPVADVTGVDVPAPDTAVADTAVADTAVADTAVADTAVADTAVADTAVADTPVGDAPVGDASGDDGEVGDAVSDGDTLDAGQSEEAGDAGDADANPADAGSPADDPTGCDACGVGAGRGRTSWWAEVLALVAVLFVRTTRRRR